MQSPLSWRFFNLDMVNNPNRFRNIEIWKFNSMMAKIKPKRLSIYFFYNISLTKKKTKKKIGSVQTGIRSSPGCSSTLGHKKSTLVERHAPEAIATAVTATCVIADVTAPWTEPPPAAAAAAIALPEVKTEVNDDETANRNLAFLRRPWQGKKRNKGFLRRIKERLWANMVKFWDESISVMVF